MAGEYSLTDTQATEADSVIAVVGSTVQRAQVFYIDSVSESAPAASQIVGSFGHFTAAGTGDAITPQALDASDVSANCTGVGNHSVEPTYAGVKLLAMSHHQTSRFLWVAQFGGRFISKPAAGDGLGHLYTSSSTGTPTIRTTIHFAE